jgi:hypothetical protein
MPQAEVKESDEGNWATLGNIFFIRDHPINDKLLLQVLKKRDNFIV